MTSELEQQKLDLLRSLRCRWREIDRYQGDMAGKLDHQRQAARLEDRLREEFGIRRAECITYCQQQDALEAAAEAERKRRVAEVHYERTGIILTTEG